MDIRKVNFDLSIPKGQSSITLPLMLARGYSKADVIHFFEHLEKINYGKFDRGSIGYGKYGKFIPNENCPNSLEFEIEIKKRGKVKKTIDG
jgi:hypothetical protein